MTECACRRKGQQAHQASVPDPCAVKKENHDTETL